MIVIAEAQTSGSSLLGGRIQLIGERSIEIQTQAFLGREIVEDQILHAVISRQRNTTVERDSGLHRRHFGMLPSRPVARDERCLEVETHRLQIRLLQEGGEQSDLVAQYLHLAIADLGDGLKSLQRTTDNQIANSVELNAGWEVLFSKAGDRGETGQAHQRSPGQQTWVGHVWESVYYGNCIPLVRRQVFFPNGDIYFSLF